MAYYCGSSQNPACTLALGQWNNFKETRHLSRNVGFWGCAAVMCSIFSLCAIYSQAGQLLVPIQNGLLIWAFICKESSVQRKKKKKPVFSGAHGGAAHLRFGIWTAVLPSALNDFKRSVFQSHQDISGAQFSSTLMQKEQSDLPRIT